MKRLVSCFAGLTLGAGVMLAQSVISAQSGMIHYLEGRVLLEERAVEHQFGEFLQVKKNQELRTEQGRAEVLLTPGVFLRLAENSAFRMVDNSLADTRVEFLTGSALLEVAELLKDNAVTVVFRDAQVHLKKAGLYRFQSEPAQVRVYGGEAEAVMAGQTFELKKGRLLQLDGELAVEKFNPEVGDTFARWSRRRGEYISMANISAAKSIYDSGMSWSSSAWRWNPYFGMFTFIPMRGAYLSPYGYRFWSPREVYRIYAPPAFRASDFGGFGHPGYRTIPRTMSGYSGTVAAAPPSVHAPTTAAPGAASAPISRGAGNAGGARR
jgi:hypothetical protein